MNWKNFCGVMLTCLPLISVADEAAGTLKSVRGQVSIEREGAKKSAKAGDALHPRDRITTSADSYASVGMRDQSSLSIGPNSDVDLSKYSFNPTTHKGEQQVRVRSGSLSAISGKLAKASPEAVQFNAGTITLGVRGTQFLVEMQAGADANTTWLLRDSQQNLVRSTFGLCWQTSAATSGCPEPVDRFVLLPDRQGQVGAITLDREGKTLTVDKPFAGVEFNQQQARSTEYSEENLRARYKDLLAALPPAAVTYVVRFETGSADQLAAGSQAVIEKIRAALAAWPVVPNVDVVGHTDTVGKLENNDALSLERARAAIRWLNLGDVPSDRLHVSGRGERQPFVPTLDETAEPLNRRVEITLY